MIRPLALFALPAFLLLPSAESFSTSAIRFRTSSTSRPATTALHANEISDDGNGEHDAGSPLSRRDAIGKAAAAATMLSVAAAATNANPAAAAEPLTTEPTRIELQVETDYLVRVLESFDGDMRKVLAAIVRSPFTTVQIEPPNSNKDAAKDAILRALYSYEAPDDYAEQASWLNVEETDGSFAGWLTKKRYRIAVPNPSAGEDQPLKTTVSLSNLELGVAAGVASYPLTYSYYQFEGYREEQEAKARKEAAAAKRAAAAEKAKKEKAAGGAKKEKVAPTAKKEKAAPAKAKASAKEPKAASDTAASAKVSPKGPSPDAEKAEAVWQKLKAQVSQDSTAEEATEPAPASAVAAVDPAPAPVAGAPAPAIEVVVPESTVEVPAAPIPAPLPAPVPAATPSFGTPRAGNAGMDAYDAYLKQAYATASVTEAPAPASASSIPPSEPIPTVQNTDDDTPIAFDGLSCKEFKLDQLEQARDAAAYETASETISSKPPRKASPFGSYLDSLSP